MIDLTHATNELMVSIDRKVYDNGTCTIEDLKFSVKQGEFVAIVGPSGSGKTTLLKIIAGIDQHVDGKVTINGKETAKPDIGFMFQEARLMPWLTIKQNIEMVLPKTGSIESKKGILKDSITGDLGQLLEQVGLTEFADNYPSQLSGGMKRRASLVRAFINHPPLLLMDEPFQSLDEPTANALRQILLTLWKDTQPIVLFVTHTLREALALADRVIFLSSRPSQVILEHVIDIPRPRKLEDDAINELHAQLLSDYPQLLSGSLEANSLSIRGGSSETKRTIYER